MLFGHTRRSYAATLRCQYQRHFSLTGCRNAARVTCRNCMPFGMRQLSSRHSNFIAVLVEVRAADPMMDAVLRAPQPREPAFGLIRVRAVLCDILDRVIDAAGVVGRMQHVPRV